MKRQRWFSAARLLGCAAMAAVVLGLAINPAKSAPTVLTDDWSVPHNYSDGAAHGIWDGVHNIEMLGAGTIETAGGALTISNAGVNYGWEGGRSNAPMLYTRIPEGEAHNPNGAYDFRATVQLSSQTFGNWSAAGIIARVVAPTAPSGTTGGSNADENFVTAMSFHTLNNNATPEDPSDDFGNLTRQQKRIQNGAQSSDTVAAWNPLPADTLDPFPVWLRLERRQDTADPLRKRYHFSLSLDGTNFTEQSTQRASTGNILNDGNVAMDIGLSFHTFGTLSGSAVFGGNTFTLEYIPEPASAALAMLACCGLAGFGVRRRRR